jgi:hypothetical protein
MKAISKREELEHEKIDLLDKFRKQTVRRLQHLQDRHNAVLADSILEREEFVADETDIMNNKLVIATDNFLMKQFAGRDGGGLHTVAISLSGRDYFLTYSLTHSLTFSSTLPHAHTRTLAYVLIP